jgi:SPP1 family predicted phage head-tail adaptor
MNKNEKIGVMDREITIQRRELEENAFAERVEVFTDLLTVWAAVEYPISRQDEQIADGLNLTTSPVNFTIRDTDITVKDRIVYDGENYDIINIAQIGRNDRLKITAVNVE